jgi:hypothetical protein
MRKRVLWFILPVLVVVAGVILMGTSCPDRTRSRATGMPAPPPRTSEKRLPDISVASTHSPSAQAGADTMRKYDTDASDAAQEVDSTDLKNTERHGSQKVVDAFEEKLLWMAELISRFASPLSDHYTWGKIWAFLLETPTEEVLRIVERWLTEPPDPQRLILRDRMAVNLVICLGNLSKLSSVPAFFRDWIDSDDEFRRKLFVELIQATNDKAAAYELALRLEDPRYTEDSIQALQLLGKADAPPRAIEKLGMMLLNLPDALDLRASPFIIALQGELFCDEARAWLERYYEALRHSVPPPIWKGSLDEWRERNVKYIENSLRHLQNLSAPPPEKSVEEKWEDLRKVIEEADFLWGQGRGHLRQFWVGLPKKYGVTTQQVRKYYEENLTGLDNRKKAGWLTMLQRLGDQLSHDEYQVVVAWEAAGWLWPTYEYLRQHKPEKDFIDFIKERSMLSRSIPRQEIVEMLARIGISLE